MKFHRYFGNDHVCRILLGNESLVYLYEEYIFQYLGYYIWLVFLAIVLSNLNTKILYACWFYDFDNS